MNLNQLEYLDAIFRQGNITKAAKELFVTPQAISKAIKQLESALGKPLIVVSNNKRVVRLTELGLVLAKQSARVLLETSELKRIADTFIDTPNKASQSQIGIPVWPENSTFFIPEIELQLKQEIGDHLVISFWPSEICLSAIKTNLLDITFLFSKIENSILSSKLLFSFTPKILVQKESKYASQEALTSKDLENLKLSTPLDIVFAYTNLLNYINEHDFNYSFVNIDHSIKSYLRFLSSDETAAILTFASKQMVKISLA